jgi:hypothetical protein
MSESDAGARTVQLLVSKYLLGLGWTLTAAPEAAVSTHTPAGCMEAAGQLTTTVSTQQQDRGQAVVTLLGSLSTLLRQQLASAKADITAASRHGLVHGTLLCLKYCVQVLPWAEMASSSGSAALAVPAAVAAACGVAGSSSGSGIAAAAASSSSGSGITAASVGGSSGSGTAGAAAVGSSSGSVTAAAATGGSSGSGQQLVMVHGPVPVVLHCWVTDLVALLTEVADLVKPLLSAQVRSAC